jgi:hypothetical protein
MNTDRFNHNSGRKVKTEDTREQRIEVITDVERRQEWTDEKKLALITESCQERAMIIRMADLEKSSIA